MGIISWIILGLIAGFIASKIVNKTGSGLTMDIALGVVGAIVGGISCRAFLGIGGDRGEHQQHHHRGHRRDRCAVGLPHGRLTGLTPPVDQAALQRAAEWSSSRLASIHPSTAPSLRIARFQNGARVLR